MQYGLNTFPILITNISGNPVTGLVNSDFTVNGYVGTTILDSGTITESPSAAGYYTAVVDIPVGQGFLTIAPSASQYYVTPTFYNIEATVYDVDDVYASVARQTLDTTQVSVTTYETQEIGPFKEGDDIIIDYIIPDAVAVSISGYSNFKASLYDDSILTSLSGAGYIDDFTLTVDVSNKSVRMHLPAISGGLVSEGLIEEYFYSDLQATTNDGYNKTLAEFAILLRRNFTRP